jgi:acetyl esterase/lipase
MFPLSISGVPALYAAPVPHEKHVLDVYAPRGAAGRTVIVFVHGGGLTEGDRSWYRAVGRSFAAGGYVAVVPSYRYFPAVRPMDSARDVVRAVQWVHLHIRAYGGDPEKIVLVGHSAGGWLVNLVMMDRELWRGSPPARAPVVAAAFMSGDFADIERPAPGEPLAEQAMDTRIAGPPGAARRPISPDSYPVARVPWLLVCSTRDDPGACDDRDAYARALHRAHVPVETFTDRGTHMGEVSHLHAPGTALRTVFDAWLANVVHP